MSLKLISLLLMIFFLVAIVVADVWLLTKKKGATFSEVIRGAGRKYPSIIVVISFSAGALLGHWFL